LLSTVYIANIYSPTGFSLWRKDGPTVDKKTKKMEAASVAASVIPQHAIVEVCNASNNDVWVRSPDSSPSSKTVSPTRASAYATNEALISSICMPSNSSVNHASYANMTSSGGEAAGVMTRQQHLTKTEMLLARRNQTLSSNAAASGPGMNVVENIGEIDACLITSV